MPLEEQVETVMSGTTLIFIIIANWQFLTFLSCNSLNKMIMYPIYVDKLTWYKSKKCSLCV